MQAIVTKYFGPTNHSDPRVRAECAAGKVTVVWDDRLDVDGNHLAAARALCVKLGWTTETHGKLVGGGLPSRFGGSAFVLVNRVSQPVNIGGK